MIYLCKVRFEIFHNVHYYLLYSFHIRLELSMISMSLATMQQINVSLWKKILLQSTVDCVWTQCRFLNFGGLTKTSLAILNIFTIGDPFEAGYINFIYEETALRLNNSICKKLIQSAENNGNIQPIFRSEWSKINCYY